MLSSLVSLLLLLFDDQENVQLRKTEQILELSSTIFLQISITNQSRSFPSLLRDEGCTAAAAATR